MNNRRDTEESLTIFSFFLHSGREFAFPATLLARVVSSEDQPSMILHCSAFQFKAKIRPEYTSTSKRCLIALAVGRSIRPAS
jgi:hypothetical protein